MRMATMVMIERVHPHLDLCFRGRLGRAFAQRAQHGQDLDDGETAVAAAQQMPDHAQVGAPGQGSGEEFGGVSANIFAFQHSPVSS